MVDGWMVMTCERYSLTKLRRTVVSFFVNEAVSRLSSNQPIADSDLTCAGAERPADLLALSLTTALLEHCGTIPLYGVHSRLLMTR